MQPATSRHHLPPHLIVLFDALSNSDFMSLTKRSLKEKVEVLKNAVAAELAKRAGAASQRPVDPSPRESDKPVSRTNSPDPSKSVPKPVRPSDRIRDADRGQGTRQQALTKNSGLKQSAVPHPPKFSDLIRLASDRNHQDDDRDSQSPQTVRRGAVNGRRQSPDPRRRQSDRKSPDRRPEPRTRPADDFRQPNRPAASDTRYDRRSEASSSIQSRGRHNELENESRNKRPGVCSRPFPSSRAPANSSMSNSRNGQKSSDSRKGSERDESDRRPEEKKQLSARTRKKNDEERMIELRKQRIREEEERVKLRNEVLAGKKNSADLKTLVTKSQGSTVLSCGRPPTDPSVRRDRPPDRSHRQMDQRRGPVVSSRESYDRYRPADRDPYAPNRYYNDYDDDEDEEMEDFIDDNDSNFIDDGEVTDVSQHIREIFGYDKRKYADFDDDDIEESSFAQVQKEEMRSARLGRKEDLEDMKMELMKKKEKRRLLDRS